MKKHNGIVSLWKFIFAIVIVFFHTNVLYPDFANPIFRYGYVAVEFFFLITGYYFAKNIFNKEKYNAEKIGEETKIFIFKKIKSFWIPIVIAYILNIILLIIYGQITTDQLVNSIWNVLLLKNVGLGNYRVMGQLWYLTSMLVSFQILYPLLKKYKENFIYLASPLIIVLGLGYMNFYCGNLNIVQNHWSGIVSTSLIRGFVEINIGMVIYFISRSLLKVKYTTFFKVSLTIIGEYLLIMVLLVTTFIDKAGRYDYVMLLMMSIATLIICSEKTFEYRILSNKFTFYLEKISLLIYINHLLFISLVSMAVPFRNMLPLHQSILSVIFTVLFTVIEERILKFISKIPKHKIKKLFVIN